MGMPKSRVRRVVTWTVGVLAVLFLGGFVMYLMLFGAGRGPLVSATKGAVARDQRFSFTNFTTLEVEGGKGITYEMQEHAGKNLRAPCLILALRMPGGDVLTVSDEKVGNGELKVGNDLYLVKGLDEHLRIAADGTVKVVVGAASDNLPQEVAP